MELYCCDCIPQKEFVEAVTVVDGNAYCIRHMAEVLAAKNPHIDQMGAKEWEDRLRAGWNGSRWDAEGAERRTPQGS